jgi:hypothetical protein
VLGHRDDLRIQIYNGTEQETHEASFKSCQKAVSTRSFQTYDQYVFSSVTLSQEFNNSLGGPEHVESSRQLMESVYYRINQTQAVPTRKRELPRSSNLWWRRRRNRIRRGPAHSNARCRPGSFQRNRLRRFDLLSAFGPADYPRISLLHDPQMPAYRALVKHMIRKSMPPAPEFKIPTFFHRHIVCSAPINASLNAALLNTI